MPSTTTTNVTFGTLPDLIGPTAPTPASDNDQPAFDSLLQSPPTPTPAAAPPDSPAPASSADEKSLPAYAVESSAERGDSAVARPQSSADGDTSDLTSEAPSAAPQDPTAKATWVRAKSSKAKTESSQTESPAKDQLPAKDRSSQAAEPVVAESLAGLAAVAPAIAPAVAPVATSAVIAEGQETKELEPVEPKSAGVKQAAGGSVGAIPTPIAKPPATDAALKSDVKTVERMVSSTPSSSAPSAIQVTTIQVAAAVQPVAKPNTTQSTKSSTPEAAKSSTTESAKGESAPSSSAPSAIQASTIQVAAAVPPTPKSSIAESVNSSSTESAKPSATESTENDTAPRPSAPSAIQVVAAAQPAARSSIAEAAKSSTTESTKGETVASGAAVKSTDAKSLDGKASDAKSLDAKSSDAKSSDEQAESSDDASQGRAAVTQEVPAPTHKQHQAPSNDSQPALALDPTPSLTPSVDTGIAVVSNTPPTVAPAAAAPPTLAAGPKKATSDTDQVTNITSPPRPRLPAELLVQAPTGPSRRATVEIDATRLLTRVARAFTAAQERDGEIRLRLSPPELGSLRLEVRVQDGAMVARLQTETDAARTAIIDNLPALRDRLSEQGVRIERFDVDLMQRQPGGMHDQPGGRQQPDLPTAQVSVLSPPRRQNQPQASSAPTLPTIESAGGLNVVV